MNSFNRTAVLFVSLLCLPVLAHSAPEPSPSQQLPRAMQTQVNAELEIANPTSSPDGVTFVSVPGYNGPVLKPFTLGEAHHVSLPSIVVNRDEKSIYCTPGTTLALAGGAIEKNYSRVALEADHREVAVDDVCKFTQDYLFYWKAADPGVHSLRVIFTPDDGSGIIVTRTVRVNVSDGAPCSLAAAAPSVSADTKIPIARATVAGFQPVRSLVIVNDDGFDLTDTQKSLGFPAAKLPVGGYALSVVSFAADGTRFICAPQVISVRHGD